MMFSDTRFDFTRRRWLYGEFLRPAKIGFLSEIRALVGRSFGIESFLMGVSVRTVYVGTKA